MSPENRHVLNRFALKATFLSVFALAQWQTGYALALAVLFAIASMIDIGMSIYLRLPLRLGRLTYWDEAAAFTLMSGIATVIGRS